MPNSIQTLGSSRHGEKREQLGSVVLANVELLSEYNNVLLLMCVTVITRTNTNGNVSAHVVTIGQGLTSQHNMLFPTVHTNIAAVVYICISFGYLFISTIQLSF